MFFGLVYCSNCYVGIEELTLYVLHNLVKAIYVDEPKKASRKRGQHIQYDGPGFIPLNELLTNEKGVAEATPLYFLTHKHLLFYDAPPEDRGV